MPRIAADLVLRNGTVWCGRDAHMADAVAVWQDRILATGTDADIGDLIGPSTKVVDLGGRLATPGLNDSHMHLISQGLQAGWVNIKPAAAPTLDELLAAVRKRAQSLPPGHWVLARGYDQTKLDVKRHPLRDELDAVAPDHPVMLVRTCGHIAVCNSRALALASLTEDSPVPSGAVIERCDGRLTGLLAENALDIVYGAQPPLREDDLVAAIERGGRQLLSYGITSCMDAAVGMLSGFSEISAYHRAKREGRLPVRAWLTLLGDPGRSIVPACHAAGLVSGTGDDMLMIGAVKLFLDGSAGGRTAWMSRPYLGDDQTCGVQMLRDNQLTDLVMDCHGKGYQLACHAIGDAAIDQLITAYEQALTAMPDADRRHRIEHCGFSSAAQHARMRAAGLYPCPQQVFIYDFGDAYLSVLGERGRSSYPLKTWMDLGLRPATGSDAPVCDPNPFPNIYSMLTRKTWKGTMMDAGECVSLPEALQAYTENGAFSQKQERRKGRLLPGLLADIAVFSRNLFQATPEEILSETRVDLTVLGGKVVYGEA